MPYSIGEIIHERYRIAALLGQGGMGNLYRAWDLNLKIPVALKENLERTPEAQAQFSEEARLLARLSHPNLPRVSDYFVLPGQGEYLVMDYIEGEDLESKLNSLQRGEKGLLEKEAVPWMIQICEALSYLHQQTPPVIHRDVKPANIKIDPKGRAVLVDFGIAKRLEPARTTQAGARAVTPGFSPPEQYGGAPTDARSDVYALGATLYNLLTGQEPPESVRRASLNTGALSPRQLNPAISPAIEQVILRAMALPMDQRYQDMPALQSALQAALQVAPYAANSVGPDARPGSPGSIPGAVSSLVKPASAQVKPVPVPVGPLPRKTTTPPPPAPGFWARYWPLLLLGGVLLVIMILTTLRVGQNRRAQEAVSAGAALQSPTLPWPTATSPIDSLLAKQNATQTAAALASPLPGQTPSPAVTPTIPAYPRQFYDPFSTAQGDWFTGIEDNLACWIAGGRYTCQSQAGAASNHFQWLEDHLLPSQFVLSAVVWPGVERPRGLGDANAGLVFQSTEQGRYLFSIRNDGFFRLSSIQSSPANWIDIIPWTRFDAIRRGQDNRLAVVANGRQYSLFINDQYAGAFSDNLWVEGYPGLHLFSAAGEKATIIEFDNFELRHP